MEFFTRDDGRRLRVIAGFRERVLAAPRVSVQPKPEWSDDDYRAAAAKKAERSRAMVEAFSRLGGVLEGARALELGCGAGIDSLLLALRPVRAVVGIDIDLPLFDPGERGERTRRLTRDVLTAHGVADDVAAVLRRRPVRFARMDATRTAFPDHSFDLLWSKAAMEHIAPLDAALAEMARVVKPGGLIYHGIDQFYGLKGCHKAGLVDLPWAHARLSAAEYHRFVAAHEGEAKAARRARHLRTLNQLTPSQWRQTLDAGPFEILEWTEEHWPPAEALLAEHPDVRETLLDGVEPGDLTCRSVKVWLRHRGPGGR
jgi:SAM-dependent methyltransferase